MTKDKVTLKPCQCGAMPRISVTYDTLQVVCDACGRHGEMFCGDYYDEGFMSQTYGDSAIQEWNDNLIYED